MHNLPHVDANFVASCTHFIIMENRLSVHKSYLTIISVAKVTNDHKYFLHAMYTHDDKYFTFNTLVPPYMDARSRLVDGLFYFISFSLSNAV